MGGRSDVGWAAPGSYAGAPETGETQAFKSERQWVVSEGSTGALGEWAADGTDALVE